MARRTKIHVGLEIGTSKTCIVVGEVKPDGAVKILGIGVTKSVGVRKGEIADFVQARACLKDALARAEDSSDVEIGSVFLAVTGAHMQGVN
ncbi:MAG: cell division protein FtsA, partial [bacterium]